MSPKQRYPGGICVCVRAGTPTPFTDNVAGTCAECGAAIVHRPHDPGTHAKVCISCADVMVAELAARGEPVQPAITRETAAEVAALRRRRMN